METSSVLPPTSAALQENETRPYFLWWTDVTVGGLKKLLASDKLDEPKMLQPLTVEKLREFRDALAERLKRSATP